MNLAWARNHPGLSWGYSRLSDVWSRPIRLVRGAAGFPLTLWVDLLSANVLVWVATFASDGTLSPDTPDYFVNRYRRLAARHLRLGHRRLASHLEAKADTHCLPDDGGEPPYAAAMALPVPRRYLFVDAVSRNRLDPSRVHDNPTPPPAAQ